MLSACASRVHHRLDVFSSYGAEHDLKEDGVGQLRELVLSLQEELAAVRKEGRADRTALLAQLDAARSDLADATRHEPKNKDVRQLMEELRAAEGRARAPCFCAHPACKCGYHATCYSLAHGLLV